MQIFRFDLSSHLNQYAKNIQKRRVQVGEDIILIDFTWFHTASNYSALPALGALEDVQRFQTTTIRSLCGLARLELPDGSQQQARHKG